MNLDGFSMRPLTIELSNSLVGGRIDKITQQSKTSICLQIRQPGENFLLQVSVNPQNPSAQLIKNSIENLPEPPTFCMVLRKNLEAGRIANIRQYEVDRVILIDVDTLNSGKIETLTLIVELVGKYSNIILTSDGIIIDALKKIGTNNSRVRTVLPNQNYQLPPPQDKLDLFKTPIEDVINRIKSDDSLRIDKAVMNVCQGFGPVTVKEVIFNAGLSNDVKISELDAADFDSLKTALIDVITACKSPTPCMIVSDDKKVLAISSFKLNMPLAGNLQTFNTISEMLEAANNLIGSYVPPDKEIFERLVRNELKRAKNKISVLEKELDQAENADDWRILADNLLTYQYNLKDHADDEINVINIYSETGESIKIPLDKKITITANVQAFYKKYDKLKRSSEYINEQIALCHEEINYLESIEHSLTASTTLAEIDEIKSELIAGRYLKESRKKSASSKKAKPFVFHTADGTEIIVGKNNYQNDKIRQSADPNDIWLHTKDIPGSHVILKTGGIEPNEETLLTAAKIAAYFSQYKDSSNVPVDYTACKFVKKPSGSKPGFVIFFNQHTIYVTPDKESLSKILVQSQSDE